MKINLLVVGIILCVLACKKEEPVPKVEITTNKISCSEKADSSYFISFTFDGVDYYLNHGKQNIQNKTYAIENYASNFNHESPRLASDFIISSNHLIYLDFSVLKFTQLFNTETSIIEKENLMQEIFKPGQYSFSYNDDSIPNVDITILQNIDYNSLNKNWYSFPYVKDSSSVFNIVTSKKLISCENKAYQQIEGDFRCPLTSYLNTSPSNNILLTNGKFKLLFSSP